MSTVSERLLDRVRMDLGDLSTPFDFQFVGDGVRDHFNIEHRPINSTNVALLHNGSFVVDPGFSGIFIDYDAGVIVFATPPVAGDFWEIQGEKWRYFSDADLQVFIDTAVTQVSSNRGDSSGGEYTLEDLRPVEEYPTSLLAVIQALWALATDAAFDIDILAPDGVNIPRSERYRQLMDMVGARQSQFDEMAAALNIGIKAIEVFTVRRTAKLTNRLVPVFLPQEYDDRSKTKRVFFPPMLQGTTPLKTGIGTYNVDVVSGSPHSFVLDFPFDLTGCEIENAIRLGATGGYGTQVIGPPIRKFTQTIVDAAAGQLRLSLTGTETRTLPYNAYWEIQVTKPGETDPTPYLRGMVRASSNEVVR